MTPQEKAEDLITKYMVSEDSNGWQDVRDVFAARRCALIAVEELIQNIYNPDYWISVKQEIEKL